MQYLLSLPPDLVSFRFELLHRAFRHHQSADEPTRPLGPVQGGDLARGAKPRRCQHVTFYARAARRN